MNQDNEHDDGRDPLEHLYAYRPPQRQYPKRRLSIRYILGVVLLLFIVTVWVAYPRGAERYEDVNLPLIRADKSAYKVAPTERGGQFIAHQDSTVFEPLEMRDDKQAPVVENILPEPEEAMDRRELPKSAEGSSIVQKPSLNLDVKLADDGAEVITFDRPKDMQDEATTKVTPVEEAVAKAVAKPEPKPQPKIQTKPKAQPITAPKTLQSAEVDAGLYYIQLGAFRDKISAEEKYKDALKTHGAIIRDIAVHYHYVDLGAKGIYYRVKVGPMSQGLAAKKCGQIKVVRSEGCFVTK